MNCMRCCRRLPYFYYDVSFEHNREKMIASICTNCLPKFLKYNADSIERIVPMPIIKVKLRED